MRMPGEVVGGESVEALSRLGYRPALDGVRAMAILAVLGYHGSAQLKGGFIGVDIFFVLSGFLITTLLFQEWSHAHAIALGNFYGRRARRLLPALFLAVAGVGLIYAIDPSLNHGISFGRAALVVIFYAGNWVAAFADNPTQVLALLDHTWSLAVEEQFYILWPLLLLICLRRRWRPRSVVVLALTLACASALLRWSLLAARQQLARLLPLRRTRRRAAPRMRAGGRLRQPTRPRPDGWVPREMACCACRGCGAGGRCFPVRAG